ncbi:MAG: Ldh family oxidoreductase [Gemmatimonadaceae bacterium]|nr:Ldh family oxidoreductase [Gemmatimonadaceae bacterium]
MSTLQLRNYPPPHGIRVPAAEMRRLTASLLERAGMPRERASWLAALLVECDLRCVFSHGTMHVAYYVRLMRDGRVNPAPEVRVVDESETTAVLDGDGGLGYFPCHRGMEMAVARARAHGLGAVTTGNHHHIGSAGLYSRMALEADCIGLAASSVRYPMDPDDLVLRASGASPLSVAVPADTQPPLVLDMGAHMLPHEPELLERFPQVFFKSLGLGAVLQVLGGVLAGIHRPEMQPPRSPWVSDQGGFVAAVAIERFMPVAEFKAAMDGYVARARRMRPYPGVDRAELPGGLEWRWERDNTRDGIPVGREHREMLEEIADEVGVDTPFSGYESTRF